MKRTRSPAPANKRPSRRRAPLGHISHVPNQLVSASQATSWLPMFMDFINNLVIESKETGETHIGQHLWGSQRRFLTSLAAGMDAGIRDFTFLKSRQLGITSICMAVDLFWLWLHPGIHGCLLIDDDGNRDKLRLILRLYAQSLPKSMRYEIVDDNKSLMSFNVGGRLSVLDFLVAGKRRGTLGASRAYRFLHATEVANYGDETGLENFLQTLSEHHPDRLFMKESTANGVANHYYTMWKQANADKLTQRAEFIGWWSRDDQQIPQSDPRHEVYMAEPWTADELELQQEVATKHGHLVTDEQLCWYRWHSETRSLDEGMLHQTQPWTDKQAFIMSGRSFFPLRKVEKDLAVVMDGESITFEAYRYYLGQTFASTQIEQVFTLRECELKVWEDPLPWGRYAIGVDPAYGRSDFNDSHCITVWRCFADAMIQVCEYLSPDPETFQLTWAMAHIASMYEDCYINFEVQGPGIAVKTELDRMRQVLRSEIMAETVRKKQWGSVLENIKWYLYHRPDSLGAGYAYGWHTNQNNKIAIMNELRDSYINNMMLVRSADALEQMQFIVQDGADIGPAAKGKRHDDAVFAMALAHRAWLDWIRRDQIDWGYTYSRAMIDDQERIQGRGRTPIVAGIVGQFFHDKEEDRRELGDNPWFRQRGLAIR